MDRTLRAALLAAFIPFAVVAGLGSFLGFEVGATLIAGVIAGAIGGLLLWGVARRADTFHAAAPPPVRPGYPGPPEPDPDPGHDPDGPDPDGPDDAQRNGANDTDPRPPGGPRG